MQTWLTGQSNAVRHMYCSTDTVAVRTVNVVKPVVLNVVRLAKDAQRHTRRNVSRIVNIGL